MIVHVGQMETKLLNQPGRDANQMTEQEYVEAVEAVLAVPNDRLRRRLFQETLIHIQRKESTDENVIPIIKLARILANTA